MLLGSNGQLGWEIARASKAWGIDCLGMGSRQLDVADQVAVAKRIRGRRYSLVINAAGYTSVDKAELERDIAFAVNSRGPGYLAAVCAQQGIPLIHISTDYVFDGFKNSPYVETDLISPISAYGESKAAGEKEVRDNLKTHIILRTSWLYSAHGNNFVKSIIRLAGEREKLQVVSDQYGCPTYAADLAAAILRIVDQIHRGGPVHWGTYHFCGQGVTNWHTFAQTICEMAKKYIALRVNYIEQISTGEYSACAKRPHYSALNCSKIEEVFDIRTTPWRDSLAEMISSMFFPLEPLRKDEAQ
ncbi:MAG: dTDP-4-dehydrorhamnose reductase [Pseudomonadota bacterium]